MTTPVKIVVRPNKTVVRVTKDAGGAQVVKTSNIGGQVVRVSRMGVQGPPGANHPAQLAFSLAGRTPASPLNVFQYFICTEAMTIVEASIEASAEVAATGTYVLKMIRCSDDADMVTFTWSAGQTVPAISVLIPALADGLKFRWEGQNVADATLADIAVNVPALRADL